MSDRLKNSFYRTLELDAESREALKWYRSVVKKIKNDEYPKTEEPKCQSKS